MKFILWTGKIAFLFQSCLNCVNKQSEWWKHCEQCQHAGVSILCYINISIYTPILVDFIKKLGPSYNKLRCDKFGNWSISTKNALNNQIQSSMKIYMYIVWNCCLPIADFETTGVHVNHVYSVVMPSQNKPTAWILGRKSQQEKRTLLTFQIGKMWESAVLMKILALRSGPLGKMRRRRADSLISFGKSDVMSKLNVCEQAGIYMHCPGSK